MGIYIDTKKVKGGLQYYAGQLCIAKAQWVKRGGAWKLNLYHLTASEGNFGIMVNTLIGTYETQADVFKYLSDVTTRELK